MRGNYSLPPGPLHADDTADSAFLDAVHPHAWKNPVPPRERYHLVVIGAGTAGLVTAAVAAGLGARVALVERERMGGDCLNVGCVPSKAIIRGARAWREARAAAARFGGPQVKSDTGDFAALMQYMRSVRASLAPADSAERFRALGVDVYFADARFVARDAVVAGDARLGFRRAVIATGARASVPEIPGLRDVPFHTNETIFGITTLPRRLVVIGAGPVGCELAQAFAQLGTHVTLVGSDPRVLPRDEPDAADIVAAAMQRDGVELLLGATASRAAQDGGSGIVVSVDCVDSRRDVQCDALLVATGRTPNVESLALEVAQVGYDLRSGVRVDDHLRTTNPRIYACGDVASTYQFTHSADFQARLVVQNALFFGRGRASRLVTPWVTYTSPEVAHVGLTSADVARAGIESEVVKVPMQDVDRARLDDETEGFCRVTVERGSDRMLGVTLVGAHAGENVGEAALAMTAGLGLGAIGKTMHPYPTHGEVLRKAADAWRRTKLTPRLKRWLALYFRLFR